MITPNKVVSLDESILGHLCWILDEGPESCDVAALFDEVCHRFESLDQFILTLDVLYVLGRIQIDFSEKRVVYVA